TYSKVYDSENDTVFKYVISDFDNLDIKAFEKETGLEGVQDYIDGIKNAESTQNVSLPHKTNEDDGITQAEEDMMNNLADNDMKEISENGIDSCYEHKLWEKIIFYPFIIIKMMNFHSFLMLIAMYSLLNFVLPFAIISEIFGEYLEGKPLMNIIALIIWVVL